MSSPRSSPTRRATRRWTPTRSRASAGASSASARTARSRRPRSTAWRAGRASSARPRAARARCRARPRARSARRSAGATTRAPTRPPCTSSSTPRARRAARCVETIGGRGLGEAELQLAVTVDSSGTPIKATVIGSGTVNAQLTGKLAGLSGKPGVVGKRADVRLDLDLTDPANRQAFTNFVQDPVLGRPRSGRPLRGRLADRRAPVRRQPDRRGPRSRRLDRGCRVWARRGW